ncbi:MAG: FkbM family methyltransferase [Alphaproteobacteria bacterium]
MSDLSTPPRARLFTTFGTVLYVDAASGELRHGPSETSPPNATFVADPSAAGPRRRGWLAHERGGSRELIVCLEDRCHCALRSESAGGSASPTLLELIPLERGLIALKAADVFLSAIPDGRIGLSAPVCSTWELFLASEAWCTDAPAKGSARIGDAAGAKFDKKRIESYIVDPLIRKTANANSKSTKVLIYGYPQWSHGRIYYDLCKHLHERGYVVDILSWQVDHSNYMREIIAFYDLFMTALDGVRVLVDTYGVPYDKIIAVSHHEFDIRTLTEQKGVEVFRSFASYGVVSEPLYCSSLMSGVPRIPMVASVGVNFSEFYTEISERLATVGYASSMSARTYGIEWKRGELAEAAAREAGLAFKVAGSTANQISFHDMPDFYRSVDAVLTSSISEAAQLPVMEAAAAGRLVICTPVGHFPRKAYEGGGIMAPIEAGKFKTFAAETLRYYKENPAAYTAKCHAIQEAALKFDWEHAIGDWIELIESANHGGGRSARADPARIIGGGREDHIIGEAPSDERMGRAADRAMLFAKRADAGEERINGTIVRTDIGGQRIAFFVTNPNDEIMNYHHRGSFYEMEELELIKRHYAGTGVFVDVGANVGNHAIYISRFAKSPRIILFEPNKVAIAILRANLLLNNCANVDTRFLGVALAAHEGRLKSATPDANNLGHTVFYPDDSGDVFAIAGDALLLDEPVEFIKIDVEGMEIDILSGLDQTISRWRPGIFVEIWDIRLAPFLDWCERQSYYLVERFRRYEGIQNYVLKPISSAGSEAQNELPRRELRAALASINRRPDGRAAWRDLAKCYVEIGRKLEAAVVFAKRIEMGGRAEEIWYARSQHARCLRDLGDEEGFLRTALQAFRERPRRAEPLHDLARYYLGKSRGDVALGYADAGLALSVPEGDVLGVEQEAYETGIKEAFTIAASYSDDPTQKERGRLICNWLAMSPEVPAHVRGLARHNARWYVEPAQSMMPSLQFHPLSIAAPDGFKAGIISIVRDEVGFTLAARAINYDLLESGYFDRHGDTSFRSRVLLLNLDDRFATSSSVEVLPPHDMPPPRHFDSLGFEDPRPVIWHDDLWCVSAVRQLNPEGRAEMVLARVDRTCADRPAFVDWRILASGTPQQWEKNWMPQVIGDELRFIYSVDPTRIVTEAGVVVHEEAAPIAVENFRGGSQAIPFDGGWLMLIHEWELVHTSRHYLHRFVWLDGNNRLSRLSRRFFFRRVSYEFAAGLAWHVHGERLVISFSLEDREPFLAVVEASDVRTALLEIEEHRRASGKAIEPGRLAWEQLRADSR